MSKTFKMNASNFPHQRVWQCHYSYSTFGLEATCKKTYKGGQSEVSSETEGIDNAKSGCVNLTSTFEMVGVVLNKLEKKLHIYRL